MSIRATCHCGAQFVAKPELAGKVVNCPTCGQSFQVPAATRPAPETFVVKCPCGASHNVKRELAGSDAVCTRCQRRLVIPHPGAAQSQQRPRPRPSPPTPSAPLDNLGDLGGFNDPLGAVPNANPMGATRPVLPTQMTGGARKSGKAKRGKPLLIAVGAGSGVVIAILGILAATFLFFPKSGYATPEEAYLAQQQAFENKDWKTLFDVYTPESQEMFVGVIAFFGKLIAAQDAEAAAILERHGVELADASANDNPLGFLQALAGGPDQMKELAQSIKNKRRFFVDALNYVESQDEGTRQQMGVTQDQLSRFGGSAELTNVTIDGDNAQGSQSMTLMGRTMGVPIAFRRIDGRWYVDLTGVQGSGVFGGGLSGLSGAQEAPFLAGEQGGSIADNPLTAGALTGAPQNPGETPESTLHAYYYYGDRGEQAKLQPLIVNNIVDEPLQDGPGRGEAVQNARGIVIDHSEVTGTEATLYYRTWFSSTAARRGGRPSIAKLVNDGGVWKLDVKETLSRTMQNSKGKSQFGFYDGSPEWWK